MSEDYPQYDTDESYSLDIESPDNIILSAATVYGTLRGLETLSQLVVFDFDKEQFLIPATPIAISDSPRYKHRGLLLDTSRHYQPISSLKKTIDALSYAKFNVLHWFVEFNLLSFGIYFIFMKNIIVVDISNILGMLLIHKVFHSNQLLIRNYGKVHSPHANVILNRTCPTLLNMVDCEESKL
jgi:hypothetical protein